MDNKAGALSGEVNKLDGAMKNNKGILDEHMGAHEVFVRSVKDSEVRISWCDRVFPA